MSASAERWVLALVTLTVLMVSATSTILTIALPTVVRHFNASTLSATWLLLVPSLVSTCLLIVFGRVADMLGRQAMFTGGLALFTAAAVAAGFSPNIQILIGLLAVEAVASAMLLCNTGAIVASIFSGPRLNHAMGIYLAGVSVAGLLGPTVGGFMADQLGWRWVFWSQAPLGLICLTIGLFCLRSLPPRTERGGTIDVVGALAIAVTLTLLLLGMSMIQSDGIESGRAGLALLGFLILVPVVVGVERRAKDPIFPFELFRNREFRMANFAALVSVMPRFTAAVLIGLYFQSVTGSSAMEAGLKVIPLPVGVTIGSVAASWFANRMGERSAAIVSSVITVVGLCFLLPAMTNDLGYVAIAVPLVVLGVGIGVFATINSAMIIGRAPDTEVGVVNGVRLTVMTVGGTIATAGGLSVATSALPVEIRAQFYEANLEGTQHLEALNNGFVLAIIAMIGAAILSAVVTARIRNRLTDDVSD
uniref:MFS transporter n=1 Tax=Rhodococcus qingshengii TaxID=334542 RepID=UPI001C4DDED2|nr:MFS transporter [Rhodococcus qingshengii]